MVNKQIVSGLIVAACIGVSVAVYSQDLTQPQAPQSPVVIVPGAPPEVNPEKPAQPAVTVTEAKSPAAPSHYTDQAIWGVMVAFALQYLKKKAWFPWLTETSTARLKAQFGFLTAFLTAAGIHFAVTGSVLDGGGAAITITGLSFDAIKDIGWQWAAQQTAYRMVVKE